MSEETIFDQKEVKKEKQSNGALNDETTIQTKGQTPSGNDAPNKNKKRDWKTAGIAGAAGLALGVLTPVQVFPDGTAGVNDIDDIALEDGSAEDAPVPSEHIVGHDMDVATGVDDSMSFSQAFAAARHEVGPGGLFVWHGNTYGTYYANEWNAMSPEEHDQYWADVYHTTSTLNEDVEEFSNSDTVADIEDGQEADLLSENQEQQETEESQDTETSQENLEGDSANIEEELVDELSPELDEQADNIENLESVSHPIGFKPNVVTK